jgi:hypothetical protein
MWHAKPTIRARARIDGCALAVALIPTVYAPDASTGSNLRSFATGGATGWTPGSARAVFRKGE